MDENGLGGINAGSMPVTVIKNTAVCSALIGILVAVTWAVSKSTSIHDEEYNF